MLLLLMSLLLLLLLLLFHCRGYVLHAKAVGWMQFELKIIVFHMCLFDSYCRVPHLLVYSVYLRVYLFCSCCCCHFFRVRGFNWTKFDLVDLVLVFWCDPIFECSKFYNSWINSLSNYFTYYFFFVINKKSLTIHIKNENCNLIYFQ